MTDSHLEADWFDPTQDQMLTPMSVRGVVHPLRLRLLRLLQDDGPATATSLAARIEQSSGVASYHLRVLAEHGFIVEDSERGTGRDRWWKAVHRSTSFTFRMPDDPGDGASVEDAEYLMRYLADECFRRMLAYVSTISARIEELPNEPWQAGAWPLRLTPEENRGLMDRILELVAEYRRAPGDPDPRPGTDRAIFQFQMLPDEAPPTEPAAES
jgi:DNA-binding transcriptional ArsR family regulator